MKDSEVKEKVARFVTAFKEPVDVEFITRGIKLSRKQVRKALQVLRSDGAVVRTSKQHDKWIRKGAV